MILSILLWFVITSLVIVAALLILLVYLEVVPAVSVYCRTRRIIRSRARFRVVNKEYVPEDWHLPSRSMTLDEEEYNVKIKAKLGGKVWSFTIDDEDLYNEVKVGDIVNHVVDKYLDGSNRIISVKLV